VSRVRRPPPAVPRRLPSATARDVRRGGSPGAGPPAVSRRLQHGVRLRSTPSGAVPGRSIWLAAGSRYRGLLRMAIPTTSGTDGSGTARHADAPPMAHPEPLSGSGAAPSKLQTVSLGRECSRSSSHLGNSLPWGAGPSPGVHTGGGAVPTFGRPLLVGPTATCVDTDVRHASPEGPAAAPGGAAGRGHASGTCAVSSEKSPDPEIDRGTGRPGARPIRSDKACGNSRLTCSVPNDNRTTAMSVAGSS
jgi:hypothetical protein